MPNLKAIRRQPCPRERLPLPRWARLGQKRPLRVWLERGGCRANFDTGPLRACREDLELGVCKISSPYYDGKRSKTSTALLHISIRLRVDFEKCILRLKFSDFASKIKWVPVHGISFCKKDVKFQGLGNILSKAQHRSFTGTSREIASVSILVCYSGIIAARRACWSNAAAAFCHYLGRLCTDLDEWGV